MEMPEGLPDEVRALWEQFVIRFQQTTGPVQAKGLEDTAFYRQVPARLAQRGRRRPVAVRQLAGRSSTR